MCGSKVLRATNGTNWSQIIAPNGGLCDSGNTYNPAICGNDNIVVVGGKQLWISTNNGTSFTVWNDEEYHITGISRNPNNGQWIVIGKNVILYRF